MLDKIKEKVKRAVKEFKDGFDRGCQKGRLKVVEWSMRKK